MSPSPSGKVYGKAAMLPSPYFFSIFELKMASSGAWWELILFLLSYTHKPVSVGEM